jgi:hypothetical protein
MSHNTTWSASRRSTIWKRLEIVEVAHRRLAARRRMIGLRIRFGISMLGIKIENSFNLFRVFFFIFTFKLFRCDRRYWLLMKHIDMGSGVIKLKSKVMNLLLEKLDDSVALND